MINYLQKFLDQKSARQFIKFGLVGASGTVVDWLFYFIFTRWLGLFYLVAKVLSFILAAINNYIWNRVWTFRSREKGIVGEFSKFFLVSASGLFFNALIMYLVVDKLKFNDLIGLFFATATVMFWNFFANKYWTFKEK